MPLPKDIPEFLRQAREDYELDRLADQEDREIAEDDNRFAHADDKDLGQWDKKAKAARKKAKRPVLQWNRIPTFLQQVANAGRQNKPSIRINRGDEASTQHTAEFYTARIRQIEYESNVDIAKDWARDQQVTTARGFLRASTEWIPGTQNQRILVEPIENQFSVVWDRSARKYERSDADRCYVISQISKAAHKRKYGDKSLVAHMDFAALDSAYDGWIGIGKDGEDIQIAEYWLREWTDQTVPASDGQPERTEKVATISQYVIDGAQIHSHTEWLGSTIPILPQWGHEAVVDGKRRTFSLHRNAKEPQRNLNFALSNLHEQMGQQTKTPWLVPVGGIPANMENDWASVHVTPLGYLCYNSKDVNGQTLPAPTRNQWEPPIQALVELVNLCIDGIKSSMGIFDAALGAKSNETSGIAIQRRQNESGIGNFHFPDNESRTNKYLGEILIELIKKIDRPGSSVPIRTIDGKTHIVPIGQEHKDWKTGELVTHDLMSGQYGVTVDTGPSHATQRQEAYDRDAVLIQAQPELIWVIGDQLFANDDTAGAEERSERLKRAIQMKTPGLIQDKNQQQPDPQAIQQQMQQMGQKLQTTEAFAQSLHEQIQSKSAELASRLQIAQLQEETKRVLGLATLDSQEARMKLEEELGIVHKKVDQMHEATMSLMGQQHAKDLQAGAQQHATETQQGAQQHATETQQSAQQATADQQTSAQQATAEQAETARQAATENESKQ